MILVARGIAKRAEVVAGLQLPQIQILKNTDFVEMIMSICM
jgi:hypothetical protein